jgi:hypothetical protein
LLRERDIIANLITESAEVQEDLPRTSGSGKGVRSDI